MGKGGRAERKWVKGVGREARNGKDGGEGRGWGEDRGKNAPSSR